MEDWRPIGTAPKDGSSVLAFAPLSGRVTRTLVMRWDDGEYTNAAGWRTDIAPFIPFKPTHWMPLPPPPLEKE